MLRTVIVMMSLDPDMFVAVSLLLWPPDVCTPGPFYHEFLLVLRDICDKVMEPGALTRCNLLEVLPHASGDVASCFWRCWFQWIHWYLLFCCPKCHQKQQYGQELAHHVTSSYPLFFLSTFPCKYIFFNFMLMLRLNKRFQRRAAFFFFFLPMTKCGIDFMKLLSLRHSVRLESGTLIERTLCTFCFVFLDVPANLTVANLNYEIYLASFPTGQENPEGSRAYWVVWRNVSLMMSADNQQ